MSIRKSLAWTFLGQSLYFVIQYAGSVVLARLLDPHDMGVYVIALSTIGVLALLNAWGLFNYVVREKELTPARFGTACCANAMLATCMALAVFLAAGPVGHYMRSDGVTLVMRVLAIASLIGALEFPSSTLLWREQRFKAVALIQVLRAAVTTFFTIGLALRGHQYMSLAWGTISGNLCGLVALTLIARPASRMRLTLSAWREITRFGSRMMLICSVNELASRAPEFILGRVLGLSPVGLYGRASGLLDMARDNLYRNLTHVLVPSLADLNRRQASVKPFYERALIVVTGLFWPAFGGLAVLAAPLIYWVYGPKWLPAAPVLTLLCIALMVQIGMAMAWEIFVIRDEVDRQARVEIVRAVFLAGTFYLGATVGLEAAAASRVLEAAVSVMLYAPHMRRMTGLQYQDFVRAWIKSLLLLMATVLPPALLMQSAQWRHDISLLYLTACILSGIAAWMVTAFMTGHPIAEEARKLINPLIQRILTRHSPPKRLAEASAVAPAEV